MADVFEWGKRLTPWRHRLWRLVEETPHLDWLLLTKRPHLVRRLSPWGNDWPANVWLGTTVESQRWVDKRLPHLAANGAHVRFLSCEPLLDKIDIGSWLEEGAVHWVIAGGESGPRARPSDPQWFYALRDQCLAHRTPFHFKQWGDWAPVCTVPDVPPKALVADGTYSTPMGRFGKKASGRLLEQDVWNGLPAI